MDIELIKTFQRVATLGSISKTADELFLSVSSVTGRVKSLEEHLGKSLFHRAGRRIELSEEGAQFLDYVNRFLRILQAGEDKIDEFKNTYTGELNLATTLTVANDLLPKLFRKFRSEYPQIHLKLMVYPHYKVIDKVNSGKVELGIVDQPAQQESLCNRHWFEDEIIPVLAKEHPLTHTEHVTPQDLQDYPIIGPGCDTGEEALIRSWFEQEGADPKFIMDVNDAEVIKQLLKKLPFVSFLPRTSVTKELKKGKLSTLSLYPSLHLKRDISFIHRQKLQLSMAAETFLDFSSEKIDEQHM